MRRKHRPIDPMAEVYVNAVTYSEDDADEQIRLHQRDKKNQWFVVQYDGEGWEDPQPWLSVTDRFRQLCDPYQDGNRHSAIQYPSFVSVIGDTGVGKSTLLRAMIMMGQVNASTEASEDENETYQKLLAAKRHGPVTRSANTDSITDPTSSGVHLYKDITALQPDPVHLQEPSLAGASQAQEVHAALNGAGRECAGMPRLQNMHLRDADARGRPEGVGATSPILLADCEGFKGGIVQTNSERTFGNGTPAVNPALHLSPNLEAQGRLPATSTLSSPPERPRTPRLRQLLGSEYAILNRHITAPGIRSRQGKEGAEIFYARFLYAISDVLVFVTKSDQARQYFIILS